ncbi:MAG: hypothetical protein AAGF12_22220 [Myxococcota bacterium]
MWTRVIGLVVLTGCASAAPTFNLVGEPRSYRGVVAAVDGSAAVEAGEECTVLVAETSHPTFDCRIRVRCGEDVLYGSAEAGYNRCSGGDDGMAIAEDRLGTRRDGDPKLVLNLELGLVTVSDLRPDMEVVVAIPELRPQIPEREAEEIETVDQAIVALPYGTRVRVWADAVLRSRVGRQRPELRTDRWESRERARRVGADWEFVVLADHGELLEVTPPPDGCGATPLPGFLGLRLFVSRRDLVPVVTESLETEFDDGTALRLRPGEVLLPLGGSRYRTLAAGYPVEVELEDAASGEGVRPAEPEPDPSSGSSSDDPSESPDETDASEVSTPSSALADVAFRIDPNLPVDLAGGTVRRSFPASDRPLVLSLDEESGSPEVALVWVKGCHSDARVRIARSGVLVGGGGQAPASGAAAIPEGTPMFWSDGGLAGRSEAPWPVRDAPEQEGDRACYRWVLPSRSDVANEVEARTLTLCTSPQ